MCRRVVITGLGLVTGVGESVDGVWQALVDGSSGIGPIGQFDASAFPVSFGSEVDPALSVRSVVPRSYRKAVKVMCRDVELAVIGAAKAIADADLVTKATATDSERPTFEPSRFGCQIGAGLIVADIGELTTAYATSRQEDGSFSYRQWGETGMTELTPLWLLKYLPNMLACHVTIIHDCRGPSNTITCCEVSGSLSIGESRRVIERGAADVCFAGGAESKINPLGVLRQWQAGYLSDTREHTEPGEVVRPFGEDATGTVPGEAAAVLMVEAAETAEARGVRCYAEISGFGASVGTELNGCPPQPESSGQGYAAAIYQALGDAGLEAGAIDAIVPMGMGSPRYDLCERRGLALVFGERLRSIPIVTTKPAVGLCGAAASAFDVAVGALCLHHQMLPARVNGCDECELDAGDTDGRPANLQHILVCGVGFGGQHTAIVLSRVGPGASEVDPS